MDKYYLQNIVWDTEIDGNEVSVDDLPENVFVDAEDEDDAIDTLCYRFGWCIKSVDYIRRMTNERISSD